MKRCVRTIIVAVLCQLFLVSSVVLASLPVNYKSEGCVVGGKVFSLYQEKKQYTITLPPGFNLSPYEGKKVLLEGELTPPDYLVPKDKTLKILGSCSPGSDGNVAVPAKPVTQPGQLQPVKPVSPPQQTVPQTSKPVAQPQQPIQQPPKTSLPPAPAPKPPAPPPTAGSPASKPGSMTSADCRRNCQRQYDAEIQNCAGYKLGNTAKACKDPIESALKNCLNSCK